MTAPPEAQELPIDASMFTAAKMDAAASDEAAAVQQMSEEKDKTQRQTAFKQKAMAQMLKPPPAAVIREKIKQQEKAQHDAEEVEKRKIFGMICQYFDRFPQLLQKIPKIGARTSLAEAQEILNQIREAMSSAASLSQIYGMVDFGFKFLEGTMADEKFASRLPERCRWNLKGLSELFENGKFPDLMPLIMEIDIEYPWLGRRPLWLRAISGLANAMFAVHVANTNPAAQKILKMGNTAPLNLGKLPDD